MAVRFFYTGILYLVATVLLLIALVSDVHIEFQTYSVGAYTNSGNILI
jgi:hypothetical protein